MSRHSLLALVLVLVVAPCLVVWVTQLGRPVPEPEPTPPVTPAWVGQRIDALEAKVVDLSKPPPEPEPEPPPPAPPTVIERITVNGQDLADLLSVSIWKFRFRLPLDQYTVFLWNERWSRDAREPAVKLLMTGSARWGEDELTLKLPIESDRRYYIRVGELFSENDPSAAPVEIPNPIGWAVLDEASLAPDRAIHLATLTHNNEGTANTSLDNAHRNNDQTVYYKIGFTRGQYVAFDPAKWATPP